MAQWGSHIADVHPSPSRTPRYGQDWSLSRLLWNSVSVCKSAYGCNRAGLVGSLERDEVNSRGLTQCILEHVA